MSFFLAGVRARFAVTLVFGLGFAAALCTASASAAVETPSATPPPAMSLSDEDLPSPSHESPLDPSEWFSIEDEAMPSYDGMTGAGNTMNLRAQIPIGHDLLPILGRLTRLQLIKFKLPYQFSSPSQSSPGLGDTTLVGLTYLGRRDFKWTIGPSFKLPTASQMSLGSGKWSVGPAGSYAYRHGDTEMGIYTQNFFSFAGPSSRKAVSQTEFQPSLAFGLGHGWSVGTSYMMFKYNWEKPAWENVPLGIRFAKKFSLGAGRMDAGLEAEKNLTFYKGQPDMTYRINFKYRPKH